MVRVRFAPSPTGYLHIGGARTCLFNWLYARHCKGEFILRIEDTDRERSKKEYLDEILESISWLGMDWDKIFYQSQRFNIYKEYAQKLITKGKAYQKDDAIFFKYEFQTIQINDLIRGKIVFSQLPKEEEVIIKKDGSPTYNFSCVVDDALMGITHVIRGEDHIPNTPKQILMYKALGFKEPLFAHVPLILSPEGGRLSKRFGATSIREFKEAGYLAESLVNYLLLLSWSPKDNREILSIKETIELFDIKDVNKSAAEFSLEKLDWINSFYIKSKNIDELAKILYQYTKDKNFLPTNIDLEYFKKVVFLFRERLIKLSDFLDRARFCFYDDYTYLEEAKEILNKNLAGEIEFLKNRLNLLPNFDKETIEKEFREVCKELNLETKALVHPVRVAISGRRIGPGLFETLEVLGKDKVIQRLDRLIKYWQNN
ncbi:MAG: glutamate--tRNA ligase [Candidatus Omnitrophica bacterium]|nr:glutamate--tRNA ligase [Candidatus Omnitrophota bacterium]